MNVLQELGGWESETMVKRYAHLAPAQLVEHSERVANLLNGTNYGTVENKKDLEINLSL